MRCQDIEIKTYSTRFGGGRVGQGDSRGDCLISFYILLAVEIVSTL